MQGDGFLSESELLPGFSSIGLQVVLLKEKAKKRREAEEI